MLPRRPRTTKKLKDLKLDLELRLILMGWKSIRLENGLVVWIKETGD